VPVPLTLKVFKGDQLVATKDYDRDIIKIGRLSSAHLCLDDEKVSRIHSVIEVGADGTLSIIDMGSVEGTYVNGKRVNKGALSFGDEVRVGNTTIKVENATQAAAQNLVQAVAAGGALIGDEPGSAEESTQVVKIPEAVQAQQAAPEPVAAPVAQAPVAAPVAPPVVAAPAPVAAAPVTAPAPEQVEYAPEGDAEMPTFLSGPERAARQKGSGPLGVELRFMWGDQMVGEFFLRPGVKRAFSVGSAAGADFIMGDAGFDGSQFDVIRQDGDGFQLRFTGKMDGELVRKGETYDLKQVLEAGKASNDGEGYSLALERDDFAWVDLGGVRAEVCFQPAPKPILVPFLEAVDFTVLNVFLLMFFMGALFVITALNRDAEGSEYADELSSNQARIAKLIIKPPEVEKKNPLLEKLNKQKEASGEIAAKHRGDEGKMGKKDAPQKNARAAPKGDPNNKDQARMLTQKIFGGGSGGISTIFGKTGLGGELKSAMGNMFGAAPGDAQGFGGLGLRGSGGGGGGVGDTIGIGGIGTKGRGGGMGKYGDGIGLGMGGKGSVDIGITSSEPLVMGSLDKELIRQVIHRNRNQIRYCYEAQLPRYPKLSGRVTVKFVITAEGGVSSSNVSQSTAGNAELETCVAGRVRTWQFPKPKGGGVVIVSYPFIFKQSGD
jgi:TonB family protein